MAATKKKAPPSKSGTKSKKRAPCRTTSGKTQGKDQTRERRQSKQQTRQAKQQRQTRQVKQQRQTQTGKRSAPTSLEKELRGVNDVYLTPKSIAIRKVQTDKNGRIVSDKTQYFDRTNGNMKTLRREMGRVRVGRN